MNLKKPVLEDLLAPGLRLVVCGAAAGAVSAARGAYYAGPGNRFWGVLHEIGLTPRKLEPREYRELLGFGIGLTDVVKEQSGSDGAIDFGRHDAVALRKKLVELQPGVLAFNGKRAARVFTGRRRIGYGPLVDRVGRTSLFVAPSTSGAANRWWDVRYWRELGRLVRVPVA